MYRCLLGGLALGLITGWVHGQSRPAPAAVVNGETITTEQVDAFLKARPPLIRARTPEQQQSQRRDALQVLIDEAVFRQFLRANTAPVQPPEIDKHIAVLEANLARQKRQLADYLGETQQSREELRRGVEDMLRWSAYAAQKVSESDLQRYYAENKPYFDRAMVRATHIVIRVPAGAPESERAAARERLTAIRADILEGRITFPEAASRYSQCPSAAQGGDLGYIARKFMVDDTFARAAFALEKNVISDVITTDLGYHLIRVVDRRPGEASSLNDPRIREAVRDCLFEEMRQKLVADLRSKAKIEVLLP